MKKLIFILALVSTAATAKFNALDSDDPMYAEYQRNLCAGTKADAEKFSADMYWLNNADPHFANKTAAQREDWVVDYVLTSQLRDKAQHEYEENCTKS